MLGVDGGNTKTLAAVADASGRTCGEGRGGTADIYNAATPDDAIAAIEAAVSEALAVAGIAADELDAAVFSLAGADWPEDFALLEAALRERLGLAVAPLVVNDALGALRGGSPDWTGIAVVSGTYNAIGARHPDGRVFHLGFWPDAAGGRELGREALRAVYHAALDMGPATVLTERALALYGAGDPIGLLYEFTRRGGLEEHEKDRLAPVVLDAADEGDAVARAIVADEGPRARPPGARLRRRRSTSRSRARASCSPAASSATRPTGSPTRRWPSCPGRWRSAIPRRRSPARCCSRSTGSPKEGAQHGRDSPGGREQGLPRRRRSPSTTSTWRSATASSWSSSARPAAGSRRCCG